ncbi:DUF4062 domain-containing protein [Elusimicrobiota bacterium]
MSEFPAIFISGSTEIDPISREVASFLKAHGLMAVRMPFGAKPIDAAMESVRQLARCQALVLILSSKYGTPWQELGGLSITELEFDEAIKRKLPIFCFIDSAPDAVEPRLQEFIKRVKDVLQKDALYDESPFTNSKACAELIFTAIRSFRWTPQSFSSFGEWENCLINHYSKLIGPAELPKELPRSIGRSRDRAELRQWLLDSGGKNAAMVSGLPGFGKTLFAYQIAREAINDSILGRPDVLVVVPGQEFNLAAIRQIVPDQKNAQRPMLLIIDDAEERSDLANLINALLYSPHFRRIKILLTCQANLDQDIYIRCSPYISRPDTMEIHLEKLNLEELQAYIKEGNLNIVDPVLVSLLQITNGIPFYLDLYFNHQYDLSRICTLERMRAHFHEQMLGDIRVPGHETELGLLKALALTGSISITHPAFAAVAGALNLSKDRDAALKNLRGRGLVYRVGTKHRIINRIVQDFVLTEFWTKKEDAALILPLLQQAPEVGALILENLGRVDWALGVPFIPTMASPFQDVWDGIRISMEKANDVGKRIGILKLFKDASYYVPSLSMSMVKLAHARFANGIKNPDQKLSADELEAAADIAYALAFQREYFETSIDSLWDFGKFDSRFLNACPSHAHRRLQSLAEFRPRRDLARYEVILQHIEKWLSEGTASDIPWDHSPIEIAREFLKHEWEETFFHGNTVTLRRGPLGYAERVEDLKIGTIKLIGRCTRGEFGYAVMSESLHDLRGQVPIYQQSEYQRVGEATLAELSAAANYHISTKHPAFAFAICHTLGEIIDIFDRGNKKEVDTATKELYAHIDGSIKKNFSDEYHILRAILVERYGSPDAGKVDLARAVLIRLGSEEAFCLLESIHLDLEQLSMRPCSSILALQIPHDAAWRDFSTQLHQIILEKSKSSLLQDSVISFLFPCRITAQSDVHAQGTYINLLDQYCAKSRSMGQDDPLARTLGSSCRWFIRTILGTKDISLLPKEMELVKSWADFPDITWGIILGEIADSDVAQARELILATPAQTSKKAADEVCSVIMNSKGLIAILSENDWERLLEKFVQVPGVDDYWLERSIVQCSNQFPRIAASFFEKRISFLSGRKEGSESYYPLPFSIEHHFQDAFSGAEKAIRRDLITGAIGFAMGQKAGSLESYYYANYVNLVAGRFVQEAKDILLEHAKSDNGDHLRVLAYIIQHSYPNFALDHPDVVEALLGAATRFGEEVLRSVRGFLGAGAGTRSWSRTTGEPSATHVNLLERAKTIKRTFVPGSPAYEFYSGLAQSAEATLEREKLEDEEALDN